MIFDTLEHQSQYTSLHPLFQTAFDWLKSQDLSKLTPGKIILVPDKLFVNVSEIGPKTASEAQLETHRDFIDIQIPISDVECMGYTPAELLHEAPYDASRDMSLHEGLADNYINVRPGQFVIFFPNDGHAPCITKTGLKKIIVKVRI